MRLLTKLNVAFSLGMIYKPLNPCPQTYILRAIAYSVSPICTDFFTISEVAGFSYNARSQGSPSKRKDRPLNVRWNCTAQLKNGAIVAPANGSTALVVDLRTAFNQTSFPFLRCRNPACRKIFTPERNQLYCSRTCNAQHVAPERKDKKRAYQRDLMRQRRAKKHQVRKTSQKEI
jgi:hypothetical protein